MDFYVILGLERGATLGEIKRAYRRLARKYHPDINPGDRTAEVFFRQVARAYETLSDPERRQRYDAGGPVEISEDTSSLEFQGFDFSVVAEGPQAAEFGELFADVFQRPRTERGTEKPDPGADLHATVSLPFEASMTETERHVTVVRREACGLCKGAGAIRTVENLCVQCRGAGSLRWVRGHMVFSRSCTACGGSGRQTWQVCHGCTGQGTTPQSEAVAVRLPAGIRDGARIRVPGKGHAGRRGGRAGDLYVAVQVAPHPLFERQGEDLHLLVPVAVHEAALGARIDVPTLDGSAKLRIPPGTQSGQRFRLRGRGAPSGPDGRAGDLVVEVRLVLPRLIDERSKELMREFGRLNQESVRKGLGV